MTESKERKLIKRQTDKQTHWESSGEKTRPRRDIVTESKERKLIKRQTDKQTDWESSGEKTRHEGI